MSILERIRKNSAIAIGLIGLALALFVITDALNSNYGIFGRRGGNRNSVGEVDGEQINIKDFEAKVEQSATNYKQRQKVKTVDQSTMDMLREQTWNQILQEQVMGSEFSDLGIAVSADEIADMCYGDHIHPQITQAFTNPQTGKFDRAVAIKNINDMINSTDEATRNNWLQFEEGLVKETSMKKYSALIKKGIYATSLEAKERFNNRKKSVDFDMIAMSFQNVPDSSVKIEESELKSYYNKNTDKYKEREDSRKLTYVLFDVIPTKEDTESVNKWVGDQVKQFAASTNDTLYVDLNSDTKFDTVAKPLNAFPEDVQSKLYGAPVGTIIGPNYNNGKFSIFKISGLKDDSVYQMRASHILFKTENGDTLATLKKAAQVMAEIRNGASFAEKAAQYGTDGTSSRGGDLGWFREGQMVKQFNDAVLRGKKGDMMILKTQFGVHVLKITEDKTKKLYCVGALDRTITASEKTVNMIYNKASQFAATSQSIEDFDKNINEKNYTKRIADHIREADKQVAGLPDAREVVRWAYNAKKNDVSEVFSIGDKYIVCVLAQIKEKNKSNFEDAKDRVEIDFRKDKKADMLSEKINAGLSGASKLQDVSTKLKTPLTPVNGQTFENANVPYVGPDNKFIGTIFGNSTTGKINGPIKGDNGVYVYVANKINAAPAPKPEEITNLKMEIQSQTSQRAESSSFEVLKDIKNVKDNRFNFY